MVSKITALILMSLLFVACTATPPETEDDGNIGNPVQGISSLLQQQGTEKNTVVFFDKTIRKIHQFDLSKPALVKTLSVENPKDEHFVIHHDQGNYIIDLSLKDLTIFPQNGSAQKGLLPFQGKPKSAAFHQALGYLVVYDDRMTVGILKLTPQGLVEKRWLSGGFIDQASIVSGDIMSDGRLALALSDNSIVLVNLEQTLDQQQWIYTQFSTNLNRVSWIAPSPSNPNLLLAKDATSISVINVVSQTVSSTLDVSELRLEKTSKSFDPHIIMSKMNNSGIKDRSLVFIDGGGTLRNKTLFNMPRTVLTSYLNLAQNVWSFVDTNTKVDTIYYNDIDHSKVGRKLVQYRATDMLLLTDKKVPDQAQIQLADSFIFGLFPSELGYAVRYDIRTEQKSELKMFNKDHIN